MSVDELLTLRDDVGKVLGQKAVELEKQLSMLGGEVGTGLRGGRSAMRGRKVAVKYRDKRQGRQHVGRARSAARVVAREAEGRREARRLCGCEDGGCSESFPEESKKAPTQEVMRSSGCRR
jgi:hypothetical protein